MLLKKGSKIVAVLYTLFIIYASLGKYIMGIVPKSINGGDKIAHCLAYLVFVVVWAFVIRFNNIKRPYFKYILIGGLLLGGLMEVCQYVFTSYRQMDWLDMVANSTGILIGYLISSKFILYSQKH